MSKQIEINGTRFTIYQSPRFEEEEVIHGLIDLFGRTFHIQFIRVQLDEHNEQIATKDPYGRYDDMLRVDSISFETIELPGYPGDWVMLIHPGEE